MNTKSIFRKSPKGAQAIATRQYGLTPKQRSMLILVDGKRNFEALEKMAAMFGDPRQLMAELEAGGFIEQELETVVAAAAPPAPAPPASTVSLTQAKRHAVRKLTDLMGPMAQDLCMRLESARTVEEYNASLTRIEAVLREVRGPSVAAAYLASLADQRPSAG